MKKFLSLLLALVLLLTLCACGAPASPAASAADLPVPEPEAEKPASDKDLAPAPEQNPKLPASGSDLAPAEITAVPRVMVLNGTTGFGMAQLMDADRKGESAMDYEFSVETDASNITAALINGSCDIAALPTNAAAALYNKTSGGVRVLALNTRGVLYLVTGEGENISSLDDLEGKTVYVPAQNPGFITAALCEKAGVNVTLDSTYAQPADLRTAAAAGIVTLAVLPEPMVTIACSANEALTTALDLTAEWDKVFPAGSLVQGCIVVRSDFAAGHKAALQTFLGEYAASVDFLGTDPDAAAEMIVEAGIFASAPVAKKAIPNCNVCCLLDNEMQKAMDGFLEIMYETAPASIGGALPDAGLYCFLTPAEQ